MMAIKVPKTIYLQYYDVEGKVCDEITWSEDKIHETDIEYVLKEEEDKECKPKEKKIFITSDLHLGHDAMISNKWRRFDSVKQMNKTIIENWNKTVSKNDTVYILGDFALGKDKLGYIKLLNGNKIFVKGNHDSNSLSHIRSMVIKFKGKFFELLHDPNDCIGLYEYVLHGHIHKNGYRTFEKKQRIKYYNVNTEFHKYKPKLLNEILEEILKGRGGS